MKAVLISLVQKQVLLDMDLLVLEEVKWTFYPVEFK